MKTEPVIKPEPGTGGDNSWKSLPAHQRKTPSCLWDRPRQSVLTVAHAITAMKSEGFVKKQGDLDVKLAAIPPYKGPQLTSQNNVSNKPKAKPKPSRASSRHSHNHGYRLVTSISGGRVTFHSGNGRRVRIFGGTSQNNRRQHKHFQRQAPFTGFCFNCGNQGHRQVTCPQNNLGQCIISHFLLTFSHRFKTNVFLALEVDQKYWVS